MEIIKANQYNQGIGKYKLLSSNAGVGSVVATKWGGFIMPQSSSLWPLVDAVSKYIERNGHPTLDLKRLSEETGVEVVEDNRFVSFLKKAQKLEKLKCLVALPHVSLTQSNQIDIKSHPLYLRYIDLHPASSGLKPELFAIPAIVFPRWFYSRQKYDFKPIEEWLDIWRRLGCNGGDEMYFAPPRDPYVKSSRKLPSRENLPEDKKYIHEQLEQVSMVLICPNGHISDIPWLQYFCAKYNKEPRLNEEGFDLFGYDTSSCECSHAAHELQWIENRNHAESFGMLRCKHCGKAVSLEGIMNLHPLCPGEKPWEGIAAHDTMPCRKDSGERSCMRWAMVTSNSVYYAENFSSLYIPDIFRTSNSSFTEEMSSVLSLMEGTWYQRHLMRHPNDSKQDYINSKTIEDLLERAEDNDYSLTEDQMQSVISAFLEEQPEEDSSDERVDYRYEEYNVFQNNQNSPSDSDKLCFSDIDMPSSLSPFFHKIQQVNTLAISSTQINFSRVAMLQPRFVNGKMKYPNGMKIFKGEPEEVEVMPANQTFGEGLFFSFNKEKVNEWLNAHGAKLDEHYHINPNSIDEIYASMYERMSLGGIAKFYLLHTFSHVIMKELEFSCGYPTASLSERLYFSDNMCGVLIYTADGAEGSMGGLVWQGQPQLIEGIIRSAMNRVLNCASDPICWENEDQLNYAACFSCAMVSETSCEERNLALDRRVLVDDSFGFFKDLV